MNLLHDPVLELRARPVREGERNDVPGLDAILALDSEDLCDALCDYVRLASPRADHDLQVLLDSLNGLELGPSEMCFIVERPNHELLRRHVGGSATRPKLKSRQCIASSETPKRSAHSGTEPDQADRTAGSGMSSSAAKTLASRS